MKRIRKLWQPQIDTASNQDTGETPPILRFRHRPTPQYSSAICCVTLIVIPALFKLPQGFYKRSIWPETDSQQWGSVVLAEFNIRFVVWFIFVQAQQQGGGSYNTSKYVKCFFRGRMANVKFYMLVTVIRLQHPHLVEVIRIVGPTLTPSKMIVHTRCRLWKTVEQIWVLLLWEMACPHSTQRFVLQISEVALALC